MTFRQLKKDEPTPYDLLMLADPSREMIDKYLPLSRIFIAQEKGKLLGTIVLLLLNDELVELKNIAVKNQFQGQGIGSYLIEQAVRIALEDKYKYACIGTANSSIGQLYLYQKLGFELSDIKWEFFISNYPEPIYEKGIQAKHLLVLTKELAPPNK